jgi:Fic family protein
LQPRVADDLASVYLAKGVAATTAIEGNTLSEDEVGQIIHNGRSLPASQQYLEQEVRNIVGVLQGIRELAWSGERYQLTAAWLQEQNACILADIDAPDHVVPGHFTQRSLIVGTYRGAPPEDVPYLVDRLCEWVNAHMNQGQSTDVREDMAFFNAMTTAILAHVYIAWIHPFGDGNGRSARVLECAILTASGLVPWVSSNLLSDFSNRTRSSYYDRLTASSRNQDVQGFIQYALDGFVDMLQEQLGTVRKMQRRVAWIDFVHEQFQQETQGEASHRRRALVLSLPEGKTTPRPAIRHLTARLAELYATRSDKTISHDLNRLIHMGLIDGDAKQGYSPRVHIMDAFLPRNNHP